MFDRLRYGAAYLPHFLFSISAIVCLRLALFHKLYLSRSVPQISSGGDITLIFKSKLVSSTDV